MKPRIQTTQADEAAGMPNLSFTARLAPVLSSEVGAFHLRLMLMQVLMGPLPMYVGFQLRTRIMRLIGFSIGRGSIVHGAPAISGGGDIYRRLIIGEYTSINVGCFFDLGNVVKIGDHVGIGHEVLILTTTHELGGSARRNGALLTQPVTIESGAWLGARSMILPGVTIGAGSVVAAGSVVNKDVPPNTLVAGSPAQVRKLYLEE